MHSRPKQLSFAQYSEEGPKLNEQMAMELVGILAQLLLQVASAAGEPDCRSTQGGDDER